MRARENEPSSPLESSIREPDDPAGLDSPRAERRGGEDRRHTRTRFSDSLRGYRRRYEGRRAGDLDRLYVDAYRRSDLLLVGSVFLLNILDAFFTLRWLEMGGREGNPLMARLLEVGNLPFLVQKCFVVGIWLVILLVHKNFRLARVAMWSLLGVYGLLLVYHLALQTGLIPPLPAPD
jgi:hypothetical protein